MIRIINIFSLVILGLLSLMPDICLGAGFAILQQGTGPMGQGNAFVAQADDPSCVFFNPAGLTEIEGNQGYMGATLVIPRITYDGYDGASEATVSKLYLPGHLYLTSKLPKGGLSFGLGIFSPFGLSTVWKGDWEGRYIGTYSGLRTLNINPNIAFEIGKFSVAVGLNALNADLTTRKKLLLSPYPDGTQELSDTTWGYGYNLGLLYRISSKWRLGLSYRSKIRLDFDNADAKFDVPAALGPFFKDTKAEGNLDLPPSLTWGVSYAPRKNLAFEFDLTWTGWSTYKAVEIHFEDPIGPPSKQTQEFYQPKKWKDVWAYRFGLRYRPNDRYTLRFGYIFDQTPVPGSTIDPTLPDGNRSIYTFGLDFVLKKNMLLGVAYNFIYGYERKKDNDILESLPEAYRANGEYAQKIHSLGISLNYKF